MELTSHLLILSFLSILSPVVSWSLFRKQFIQKNILSEPHGDPGEPLFLTPYIEKGQIDQAQHLSRVQELNDTNVISYSGFITVNKTYNSNMFFWYFPSETKGPKDPVLIWLQGGPGGSSLFGLFAENGPFYVDKDLHLLLRKFRWTTKYHMIFIDNPVGTGFSFTDDVRGFAHNEEDVSENLYKFLLQFYSLFPSVANNELYITGESYAGKYIPALAYRIHHSPSPQRNIYLRGVAIGDGFTDPPLMIHQYADFMYQTGQLDENQRDFFTQKVNEAANYIDKKQWAKAFEVFDILLNGDLSGQPSFYKNSTGCSDYYNYLNTVSPEEFEYYGSLLVKSEVRKAIHVGNLTYNSGVEVEKHLMEDVLQSAKHYLADVMNYYKVLLYTGQLDVIVAIPCTEAMIPTIDWEHRDEYMRAKRDVWKIRSSDVEVAGYVKRVHDFYQVIVRGGGHILPFDQPERSWDMIDRFVSGRSFM